ncbi:RAD55 family ATPase [Thermococcus paralvinellae]|uniref:KaiC-like domain-containing protein n=1 Tax=Thermococcus paralvinellae TaxID=582419 RepID=W0I918_9EURY|nr:ATPase domain-containing protein [Thermococcus paralvinellae]AHF81252.1 Hypothetical protein TES1_1877 [Thermococcus paralvinellae]
MELLKTGIRKLDEVIGGGLLEDSVLLIIYDTYSLGWTLGVKILKNRINSGDFGVIINTVLPVSSLSMEFKIANFELEKMAREGNLGIIDIFASFNKIQYDDPFIYYTDMDTSTFLPKFTTMYRKMLSEIIKDKRPIGLTVTMDGLAFLLGEEQYIKILQRNLAIKETARIKESRKRPLNVFLLNRDRVSKRFISWLALYSQYIVEFYSLEEGNEEKMIVRKSPLPEFEPKTYRFKLKKGQVKIF